MQNEESFHKMGCFFRGKRTETKRCDDVPDGEIVDIEVQVKETGKGEGPNFPVQVTLKDCAKVTGTQTFSLGVVGEGSEIKDQRSIFFL